MVKNVLNINSWKAKGKTRGGGRAGLMPLDKKAGEAGKKAKVDAPMRYVKMDLDYLKMDNISEFIKIGENSADEIFCSSAGKGGQNLKAPGGQLKEKTQAELNKNGCVENLAVTKPGTVTVNSNKMIEEHPENKENSDSLLEEFNLLPRDRAVNVNHSTKKCNPLVGNNPPTAISGDNPTPILSNSTTQPRDSESDILALKKQLLMLDGLVETEWVTPTYEHKKESLLQGYIGLIGQKKAVLNEEYLKRRSWIYHPDFVGSLRDKIGHEFTGKVDPDLIEFFSNCSEIDFEEKPRGGMYMGRRRQLAGYALPQKNKSKLLEKYFKEKDTLEMFRELKTLKNRMALRCEHGDVENFEGSSTTLDGDKDTGSEINIAENCG